MSMTSGEQHGRHRPEHGTWTPQVRHDHAPAHARIPPESPVEITVPGLRKFDLGTIPASVTPPRTWRKAAWFAIGASLAVVTGLAFAAVSLVGNPKNTETIDALPAYPSMPVFLNEPTPPGTSGRLSPPSSRNPEKSSLVSSPGRRPSSPKATAPGLPSAPGSVVRPEPPVSPPARTTTPKRAFATNDPKEIGDRTEAFYKQVTADPGAAYAMTTGEMRLQGEQAFRERYSDIKSVQVRQINIDPNQGTTVSEVKVTKKDGSTFVERRRLKFTSGKDPKISSEVTH